MQNLFYLLGTLSEMSTFYPKSRFEQNFEVFQIQILSNKCTKNVTFWTKNGLLEIVTSFANLFNL